MVKRYQNMKGMKRAGNLIPALAATLLLTACSHTAATAQVTEQAELACGFVIPQGFVPPDGALICQNQGFPVMSTDLSLRQTYDYYVSLARTKRWRLTTESIPKPVGHSVPISYYAYRFDVVANSDDYHVELSSLTSGTRVVVTAQPVPLVRSYSILDIGKPGVPHLAADKLSLVKRILAKLPAYKRSRIRFVFSGPEGGPKNTFYVLDPGTAPPDGAVGGNIQTFRVLNGACNLFYEPARDYVFAGTGCGLDPEVTGENRCSRVSSDKNRECHQALQAARPWGADD